MPNNHRMAVAGFLLSMGLTLLIVEFLAGPDDGLEELHCAYEQRSVLEHAALLPPVGYPVSIEFDYEGENWAESEWSEDSGFIIRIHREAQGFTMTDALIHEWAHLLVWGATQESDHDDLWAVAYGRCYLRNN